MSCQKDVGVWVGVFMSLCVWVGTESPLPVSRLLVMVQDEADAATESDDACLGPWGDSRRRTGSEHLVLIVSAGGQVQPCVPTTNRLVLVVCLQGLGAYVHSVFRPPHLCLTGEGGDFALPQSHVKHSNQPPTSLRTL